MFWRPSLAVAPEPSWSAKRCLAIPSIGVRIAEPIESLIAAQLTIGLLGTAVVGAWSLDPAVGILIAAVAVKEGTEAWRGEGCSVSSPFDGSGFLDDACHDECCAPTETTRAEPGGPPLIGR